MTPGRFRFWFLSCREQALDLLFPPRCLGCGQPGVSLCARCRTTIRSIPPPLCDRCGESLPFAGAVCRGCAHQPFVIQAIRAVGYHEGVLRNAILALKYKGRVSLADPLGTAAAMWLRTENWRVDALVPVPLHPSREQERGYNQAELIARALGREASLPVDTGRLVRVRATGDQIGLDAAARHANMRGAFAASDTQGMDVLLVDDVTTTGATFEACAAALYARGARRVRGLAVARPRWQN